jgi:hypothetical protein
VLSGGGADERVVDGAPGDPKPARSSPRAAASASPRNPDAVAARMRRPPPGDRRPAQAAGQSRQDRVGLELGVSGQTPPPTSDCFKGRRGVLRGSSTTSATAVLVFSSTTWDSSASVSVAIDQLTHRRVVDGRPGRGNDEQAGSLSKLTAGNRFVVDLSPVDFDLHLSAAGKTDAAAQGARRGSLKRWRSSQATLGRNIQDR